MIFWSPPPFIHYQQFCNTLLLKKNLYQIFCFDISEYLFCIKEQLMNQNGGLGRGNKGAFPRPRLRAAWWCFASCVNGELLYSHSPCVSTYFMATITSGQLHYSNIPLTQTERVTPLLKYFQPNVFLMISPHILLTSFFICCTNHYCTMQVIQIFCSYISPMDSRWRWKMRSIHENFTLFDHHKTNEANRCWFTGLNDHTATSSFLWHHSTEARQCQAAPPTIIHVCCHCSDLLTVSEHRLVVPSLQFWPSEMLDRCNCLIIMGFPRQKSKEVCCIMRGGIPSWGHLGRDGSLHPFFH